MANIAEQKKLSAQSAVREQQESPVGIIFWLANAGQIINPWWSKSRDRQLRQLYKDSDHFNGATFMMSSKLASVPYRVEPRDASIKQHIKAADEFNTLLDESPQFGQGWSAFWTRFFTDLWSQDNGAFAEVIGDGDPDGPIEGLPLGFAHLDSYACQRTSDPEYPVVYHDDSGDGKQYRFHYSRVMFASQMPSPSTQMHGVGHCWLTRCINAVQNLIDIAVYKQEKLGSRPLRAILAGTGVTTQQIIDSIAAAEEGMDNQGLGRYAKTAVIGSNNPNFALNLINLASLPDGFDEKTATDLGMYVIALAGGFPPRWLWPATTTGATKADALYSHIAGSGGGASWHLNMMQRLLGGSERGRTAMTGKFLPPYLKLVFDYQDDEQDRMKAEISKSRSETRKTDLETGVVTVRVSREMALSDGDLTRAQFEDLELEDGRLPDGQDVLTLFSSVDPFYLEYLDLGVDSPLLIDANDPTDMAVAIEGAALGVQDVLVNSSNAKERQKATRALAALGKLKEIYSQLLERDVAQEQLAEQEAEQEPSEEKEPSLMSEEGEESEPTEEELKQAIRVLDALHENLSDNRMVTKERLLLDVDMLVKGFNYGARVGEVITGQLARGEGGRFANAQEVAAAKNELLAGLIARLRARRAGGGRKGAAASARAANREKIGAMEGVGGDTVDALAGMKNGTDVSPKAQAELLSRGLAEMNADGSVTMTAEGRKLLSAANQGDVDKAKKALADLKKPGRGGRKRGGGGKAKKTPEQKAAEKALEEARTREETFTDLEDQTGISAREFQALQSFKEGRALTDSNAARRLEQAGYVELDEEGNYRMTADGRAILTAATKGDKRRVLDVASRARDRKIREQEREEAAAEREAERQQREAERAAREAEREAQRQEREAEQQAEIQERADGKRQQAEGKRQQAVDVQGDIDDLETELETLQGAGQNEVRREIVRARIEQLQTKMEELNAEADALDAEADEILTELTPERAPETNGGEAEKALPFDSMETKAGGTDNYRRMIRAAVRGLWSGAIDYYEFWDSMSAAINVGLTGAWRAGARECGINPGEFTEQENVALQRRIQYEHQWITGFAEAIEENQRGQGKLGPLYSRAEIWIGRWDGVRSEARTMACADKKLKWILGDTDHCESCLKLSGKVKRASYWNDKGILPRIHGASYLACRGFRCQCSLEPTDDPLSKGPLPGLP